ncbi:MAG TPA: hypothetical protein VGB04_01425 [Allosphingosinicella sp.]
MPSLPQFGQRQGPPCRGGRRCRGAKRDSVPWARRDDHLFYENTGRLSKDISPPVEFTGWNTVIGEGSAEDAADDLLVTVEVRGRRAS